MTRTPGRTSARLLLTGLAAALALTACGSTAREDDPSGAADAPRRVAAIGLGDVDTLLKLGITPVAVAPWSADATEAVGPWAQQLLGTARPALIRDTGRDLSGKAIEAIAATRPDLIVAVNSGYDDAVYDKLAAIAPVVRRPAGFEPWTVPWPDQVRAIAAGVGRSPDGDRLVTATEATIAATRAKYPWFAGRTGVTVLPKSDGGLYAYTARDGRGQVLDLLGFRIPPQVDALAGKAFYALVPAENLPVLDVNTMVYLDYGTVTVANDTAFRALTVARDNRVVTVDRNLGNAMSMPNPVTLDWVLRELPTRLPQ